ncbi:23S rRNA (guanosine-2'-O-)-methyltransferase RlmB [bacterium MnTg02]|nr:23S rRNA (guanosine-2'-O-)-methyltransferase RlmB [bacterium MnTg02]
MHCEANARAVILRIRDHIMSKQRHHKRDQRRNNSPNTLFGLHAVEAALFNPARNLHRLYATRNAAEKLSEALSRRNVIPEIVEPKVIDRLTGPDTVHQGVILETDPLPAQGLDILTGNAPVIVLDQITDPHNVGAILRSCAAFGAEALIMTARHSPALTGTLAKAASGGLEHVPVILVPNLARTLSELGRQGFLRVGLDGKAENRIEQLETGGRLVLVLGAEGKGLRRLTRENCDQLCRINTTGSIASLNVSNAAAVALHAVHLGRSSHENS